MNQYCMLLVLQWNLYHFCLYLQTLKCKYVVNVLHSSLSSSPGGETGFDRVAAGFCTAVPHLTQALREDLQVLSSLTEPHTLLGFLNVAYFGTVAQELALQMEREFETAKRDNTVCGKIKKYSARSRATVGKSLFKCFSCAISFKSSIHIVNSSFHFFTLVLSSWLVFIPKKECCFQEFFSSIAAYRDLSQSQGLYNNFCSHCIQIFYCPLSCLPCFSLYKNDKTKQNINKNKIRELYFHGQDMF